MRKITRNTDFTILGRALIIYTNYIVEQRKLKYIIK